MVADGSVRQDDVVGDDAAADLGRLSVCVKLSFQARRHWHPYHGWVAVHVRCRVTCA